MKPARFFVSASGLGVTFKFTFKFKFTLVFTFALALAWVGPAFSQGEARVKAEAKGPDGAKRDYQKERFAFAAREDFDPQALMLMEREMHEKSMKLLEAGQVVQEVKMYLELLKTYPYCLDAHKYLAKRFEIISAAEGSPEDKAYFQKKAAAHQAAYRGSVLISG